MTDFSVQGDILHGATQIDWLPHRATTIDPRYVVVHYTAGSSLSSSISYLRRKGYSYQLLIARDGRVTQGTPLTKRAAHAGHSNWKGLNSLNDYGIGISLANIGYLEAHGAKYYNTNSHNDLISPVFDREQVTVGRHWNGHNGSRSKGWENYTDAQYDSLRAVCAALVHGFPTIRGVVGHEDISIGRKPDPGMAFDWTRLRDVFPQDDPGPRYRVEVPAGDTLNVRKGPNGSWGVKDTLANGATVHWRAHAYQYRGGAVVRSPWVSIALDGTQAHHGFVHGRYLRAVN